MPFALMAHDDDPRQKLLDEVGDIKDVEVFNNQILCAIYFKPEKTQGGIYLPVETKREDQFQSKVGLVLKMGTSAFDETFREKFSDIRVDLGDWVVFRPSDGWAITVNGIPCRMLTDDGIRLRIQQPDNVW